MGRQRPDPPKCANMVPVTHHEEEHLRRRLQQIPMLSATNKGRGFKIPARQPLTRGTQHVIHQTRQNQPRRRAAAVTALSAIAADQNAPSHSRVRAAASLLAAANREDDDADDPKGKRGRPPLLVLPDNKRDGVEAGIQRNPDGAPIMVIFSTEEQRIALTAQANAELDALYPDDDVIS
jgi:hypothetical protein